MRDEYEREREPSFHPIDAIEGGQQLKKRKKKTKLHKLDKKVKELMTEIEKERDSQVEDDGDKLKDRESARNEHNPYLNLPDIPNSQEQTTM